MSGFSRLEQRLPELLDELAGTRTPAYLSDILARTAGLRQRPAWTISERWRPMTAITTPVARLAPAPWRVVGLLALLLAILLIGSLLAAGAHPHLPAPFGPAANGRIAYGANGDIYTVDPSAGMPTVVATGPEIDTDPVWSRDGRSLIFKRTDPSFMGPGWLYLVHADGTGLTRLTPNLMADISGYAMAPDGREALIVGVPAGVAQAYTVLSIALNDGSAIRTLDVGMAVLEAAYLPPDGSRVVFLGVGATGVSPQREGLYEINRDGTGLRAIVAPSPTSHVGRWSLSPDGTRLAYTRWDSTSDGNTQQQHVINLDGTGDQVVPLDPAWAWGGAVWSNDGSRLLVFGLPTASGDGPFHAVIAPIDGSQQPTVELAGPSGSTNGFYQAEWAPDDRSILMSLSDAAGAPLGQFLWDADGETVRSVAWNASSAPSWQRLAP